MEPTITFRFSDLPLELALLVFKYAAEPTFSQKETYSEKNPYADAISLCRVSRLVRRTVLPELLHTVSLHRCLGVGMFANALLMQQAYAETKNDLFFDYPSAVQRVWISHDDFLEYRLGDSEVMNYMSSLLPVLLAAPALAIDWRNLKLFVRSVENAWASRPDRNVDDRPFPGRTQSLTITPASSPAFNWKMFRYFRRESVFLASIPHLTYLERGFGYRDISKGLRSPKGPLHVCMNKIPLDRMKNLQTFSVAYPHLDAPYDLDPYIGRGLEFHVERLTMNVPLFKQDPASFSWVTPPFPVTNPGEKSIRSDGISFKVTHDGVNFRQESFTWDKAWACGLTE